MASFKVPLLTTRPGKGGLRYFWQPTPAVEKLRFGRICGIDPPSGGKDHIRMRYCAAIIAALALAGCSSEPQILAATPAMVSICSPGYSRLDDSVQLAQRQCARSGKNATLINHAGQCINSMMDLLPSNELDFRCE